MQVDLRAGGRRAALLAAWWAALDPSLIYYTRILHAELLYTLFLVLAALSLVRHVVIVGTAVAGAWTLIVGALALMGAVNAVVPHAELEATALEWAAEINGKSPTAQRMLKYAFNLIDDGLVGQQLFAGETTRLAYMTDEAVEGRDSFLEKRAPDWSRFPYYY